MLDDHEIDALLVTDEINVRYASGFTGDSSFLLVTPDSTTMLSDGRYTTQLQQECPSIDHAIRMPSKPMMVLLSEQLAALGDVRVGFEAQSVTVATHQSMQAIVTDADICPGSKKCPGLTWVATNGIVEKLRLIKDDDEIALIRRAIEIAERSYLSIVPKLRGEWSELAIAHEIEATMRVLGAEGVSFAAIIAAEPSGALPHYRPTTTRLGESASLLMDFGAKYKGYASDITRTLGNQSQANPLIASKNGVVSDKFRRAYDAVLEAQLAAIDAITPGIPASAVDAVTRQVLQRHGLADAFIHGLGHGIGLQIHESPRMSAISDETLQAGMVITVEPGVYFAGEFGIRIEDDVLVTAGGRQVLTSLPKGLDDCPLML